MIGGLAAEIATHKALSMQYDMVQPDTQIYEKKRKSYNADLVDKEGRKFHVKSQTIDSIRKYGASWLFQKTDPLWQHKKDEEFFVFCGMTLEETTTMETLPEIFDVDIFAIAKIAHLSELIDNPERTQCRLDWFNRTKRCIYLVDILQEMEKYEQT